ncbi:MAG: type IV pilus assembly protein PilM [Candidatus Gribaldobacteria bacterium]|nr:type IV pilus assembly protein PilM [Candidatus Gribaldobacteria bacterium]
MNFFSQKLDAFGLDFSDLSLKIAHLRPKNKAFSLSCFGEVRIPAGVIESGEVRDVKKLAQIIKQGVEGVKGKRLATKFVVVSLPEEKSFLDVLSLPRMPDKELESAVSFEAENYFPIPIADVYFDFTKENKASLCDKNQNIMIVATPKKIVDSYVEAIKLAGLFPIALEIESLAIARALVKKNEVTSPLLIIDFGESRTSFIIFADNLVRFTSSINTSSQQLTEAIATQLKITPEEAEKLKRENGLKGNPKVLQAISAPLNELSNQIQNHLEYFYTQSSHGVSGNQNFKITQICLCGGGSNLTGLADFLSRGLNIKVDLGNPWINILRYPIKEVPILSFYESSGYATALGLALRASSGNLKK